VEGLEKRAEAISTAISRGGIRTKRVITAVSGRLVPVRYVSMPRMPVEKLKEAMLLEANKYIPFGVEQAVLDCEPLVEKPLAQGQEPPSEIMVRLVAAKREIVEQQFAELKQAGLYPVIVDNDCFALGNAFEFRELQKPDRQRESRVIALVDIGAEKASINVMIGINSYFTREIPGGGKNLSDAVARRLSIPAAEAEELKKNPGQRTQEVTEAVLGPLEDLIGEISLSFDYFESQHEKTIEEVLVSGGTADLTGIKEVLQQSFGKATSLWDVLDGLNVQVPPHQLGQLKSHARTVPVAVGLAARILTI
jgi:type IV pilus assembly protein PilM